MHEIEWPDLSSHPEYKKLDEQKQQMIDEAMADEEDEEEEQTPKDIANQILEDEGAETYVKEVNGGAQLVLDRDLLAAQYELTKAESKQVKSLLQMEVDDAVM